MVADPSIRSALLSSLKRFQALLTWVASDGLSVHANQVPLSAWSDELGRLRVWAANVGAHQEGQSSLDYRLRDASHIRQQILRLFDDLDYTLSEIEQLFSDSGTSTKLQDLDDEDEAELQQLHSTLGDVVNCLYQISLLIRKPARHDRLLRYDSGIGATYTPWDRRHVSSKFPNADPVTIDRLGSAITKRRMLLNYRERHHQKLAGGLDSAIDNREEEESLGLSHTLATDFKDVALGISDAASVTGASETSYAKSLEVGGNITVPVPPKESENQREFLCPYCFIVITIKDRRDWAHHVFRDLESYVCIFPDCPKAEELYDSQREWLAHEKTDHPRLFEEAKAAGTAVCPLCKSKIASEMLEKHIAKHLQELALFPISMGDVEDDQLDDTPMNAQEVDKEDFLLEEPRRSKDDPSLARKSIEPFKDDPLAGNQRERASQLVLPREGILLDVFNRRLKSWFGPDAIASLGRSSTTGVRSPNLNIAAHNNWCIGRSMGNQQCGRVRTACRNSTLILSSSRSSLSNVSFRTYNILITLEKTIVEDLKRESAELEDTLRGRVLFIL
jgi:uncharacterized Zn-finger protein